jgi:hypothetical protein
MFSRRDIGRHDFLKEAENPLMMRQGSAAPPGPAPISRSGQVARRCALPRARAVAAQLKTRIARASRRRICCLQAQDRAASEATDTTSGHGGMGS